MRSLQAEADWVETNAKVIACLYEYASISDLGSDDGLDRSKHKIFFSYHSHGESFKGFFFQYEPMTEGTLLPLLYNPHAPTENNLSLFPEKPTSRLFIWLVGAALAALIIYLCEYFGIPAD